MSHVANCLYIPRVLQPSLHRYFCLVSLPLSYSDQLESICQVYACILTVNRCVYHVTLHVVGREYRHRHKLFKQKLGALDMFAYRALKAS